MAGRLAGVNTLVYGTAMNDRLTKDDWIAHGLQTLAHDGANALKAGPMAEKLKVSRGSFYWHFRDIADFRAQLLRAWAERSTDRVIRDLDARKAEPDRLKQLMKRAFAAKRDLDRAIRSWAAEDEDVAKVVASAFANAKQKNPDLREEDVIISSLIANEGPRWKRFRAAAFGRAARILKRTTHISVELEKRT